MAGALEVGEAVVVAGLDVVGLGARCSLADEAEPACWVASEDGGAALCPVCGEAPLPVAALPAAHYFRLLVVLVGVDVACAADGNVR